MVFLISYNTWCFFDIRVHIFIRKLVYRYFHFIREGTVKPLSKLPPNTKLPGIMLARRQGEVNYVRFSISRDTLKAKFQEDGSYESLFMTDKKGNLSPVN